MVDQGESSPGASRKASTEFTEAVLADPYASYSLMRQEASVCRVRHPSGLDVWLVTRYEDALAALADHRLSKSLLHADPSLFADYEGTPSLGPSMLSSDPPEHTRLRRLAAQALTEPRVERMLPTVKELGRQLLDRMGPRGEVDLVESFASPLPVAVLGELLGIPLEDRVNIGAWANAAMLMPPLTADERATGEQAVAAMRGYVEALVADRWSEGPSPSSHEEQPDLISALMSARDGGLRLTEHEMTSMLMLLLVVGHETTANLISNGMVALLRHPDQLQLLVERPWLLPSAIEELLRYDGPAQQATLRVPTEDVEIGGVPIPAGSLLSVVIASANRDPGHFVDPDRLDITRADNRHIAFGHGIHFCLGARLARLEGQVAIGMLLERFPRIALAVDPDRIPWRRSFMRGPDSVPVRLTPGEPR